MRNLGLRLALWFISVPAFIAIVILLPHRSHLVFNLIVITLSALGAVELSALFERKDAHYRASVMIIPLLGAAIPIAQLLTITFGISEIAPYFTLVTAIGMILFAQVFRRTANDFQHTLSNIAANITLLVYPGLFLSFVVRLAEFELPSVVIVTFLCAVFFNDSMAYTAGGLYRMVRQGMALRQGTKWAPRVVFRVSPNKTIIGFVAGFLLSPAVLLASNALYPDVIPGGWLTAMLIGSAVGVSIIVGDLIESAIKRSTASKDSGELVPGRGGVLDSVDSVLYAAPVFYYLLRYVV